MELRGFPVLAREDLSFACLYGITRCSRRVPSLRQQYIHLNYFCIFVGSEMIPEWIELFGRYDQSGSHGGWRYEETGGSLRKAAMLRTPPLQLV